MTMDMDVIEQGKHGVLINEQNEQQAIALMDRLDLEQAMSELRGEVIERFVYTVPGGWDKKNNCALPPKKQLSYAGVKEAARLYKNVHFGATAQQMPDGCWVLTPFAHNLADNLSCSLPLPYPAWNLGDVKESIAYRATLSKSVRMALAAVLPITYIETMISRWSEQQGGSQPQGHAARPVNQQARAQATGRTTTVHEPPAGVMRESVEDGERRAFRLRVQHHPDVVAWIAETGIDLDTVGIDWIRRQVGKLNAREMNDVIDGTASEPREEPAEEPAVSAPDPHRRANLNGYVDTVTPLQESLKAAGKMKPNVEDVNTWRSLYGQGQMLTKINSPAVASVSQADLVTWVGQFQRAALDELKETSAI